ncbi:MAG: efflux RND transporter periplasmic adaptor subunit [Gammaproteobacteria bacterium]|nr:efflux RND transporter periplasmic adaptor subunit [Gammaproteobacteria bacterium]MCP5136743.1 efflux RND transporter periplasmic adaptor subunit [Gammaproteobacteria bacterium]
MNTRGYTQRVVKKIFLTLLFVASGVSTGVAAEQRYPVIFDVEERATLSAERDGVLTNLDVDVGDKVRKGAVLASVYAGDLGIQRRQAKAKRDFLAKQYENLSNLNRRGLATDEEVSKTKTELASADAEIDLLTAQIAHSVIRAPFDGVVVQRAMSAHEWVTAGKPVVEILNPRKIRIVSNLPSNLVVDLPEGTTHKVWIADLQREVTAMVRTTVPAVDEQSNTVGVIWDIVNLPDGLLTGMKGEIVF